jgi:polyphosphate kinase 2 (PPK2 family)
VKVFLHLSKEEQRERLLEREREPDKAWKLDPNDWQERKLWRAYTRAYEDAFARCNAPPWHIVPADSKAYRNLAVAEIVAAALRPHARKWAKALDAKARDAKRALRKLGR